MRVLKNDSFAGFRNLGDLVSTPKARINWCKRKVFDGCDF